MIKQSIMLENSDSDSDGSLYFANIPQKGLLS
jgi:hypothetical protein